MKVFFWMFMLWTSYGYCSSNSSSITLNFSVEIDIPDASNPELDYELNFELVDMVYSGKSWAKSTYKYYYSFLPKTYDVTFQIDNELLEIIFDNDFSELYISEEDILKSLFIVVGTVTDKKNGELISRGFCSNLAKNNTLKIGIIPENQKYFVDERDGKEYPITVIGNVVWLAKDLTFENYETTNSKHYHPKNYKSLCPSGSWLLPEIEDFKYLISYTSHCSLPDEYNEFKTCYKANTILNKSKGLNINTTNNCSYFTRQYVPMNIGFYESDYRGEGVTVLKMNNKKGFRWHVLQFEKDAVARCRCKSLFYMVDSLDDGDEIIINPDIN